MKRLAAIVVLLALASAVWAAPPALDIPAEVKAQPGKWLVVSPTTTAASVVYIALDGLEPFPSTELKDPRKLVVQVPATAGRWRFVAVGALGGEQATTTFTIVVGDVPPVPPVPPGPTPPGPTPPVPPSPVPDPGMHVLLVWDASKVKTAELDKTIGSARPDGVRAYLTAKCPVVGGKADWAMWPEGMTADQVKEYPSTPIKALYARPRTATPWLVVSKDGKLAYEGKLPDTDAAVLALLKTIGG